MDISIPGIKCKVIAHKYAVMIEHPQLEKPFKMVVAESMVEGSGESLGWSAAPEIQLRQTKDLKQEYIVSNANPTIEMAIKECLFKMLLTSSREMFYHSTFEQSYNRLW